MKTTIGHAETTKCYEKAYIVHVKTTTEHEKKTIGKVKTTIGQVMTKIGQVMITRYSLRIAPINDALVCLAGCKAYKNKLYRILLTLYDPRNHPEKVASI